MIMPKRLLLYWGMEIIEGHLPESFVIQSGILEKTIAFCQRHLDHENYQNLNSLICFYFILRIHAKSSGITFYTILVA